MMSILSIGSLNIDHVYKVPHIVKPGETISTLDYYSNPGGKGLNLSIAISKAGSHVFNCGLVGDDGDILVNELKQNKVDTTYIDKISGNSGQAIIQVSNSGENSIFVNSGTNIKFTEKLIDKTLEDFNKSDIIILQNEINLLFYIIEKSYSKKLNIVLNPSPYNDSFKDLDLTKINYLVLNEVEGQAFTGRDNPKEIIQELLSRSNKLQIVLTLGSKGVLYGSAKETIHVDSYETKVVDTTAAGDTFLGFFISEINKGNSIKKALKVASKAASITVSRNGASRSIPDIEEVGRI